MKIKSILFDFDGVLIESLDIKTEVFRDVFKSEGDAVASKVVDYHVKNMGKSRLEKFYYIYDQILNRPLSDELYNDLCQRFSELALDKVVNAEFVSGADSFLKNHAQFYECFIVSATPEEELIKIVHQRKLDSYFKGVFGAPKKKVEIVRELIEKKVVRPENAIFVGDAWVDYLSAKENNVLFIARLHELNENVFNNVDCPKINDLTSLLEIVKKIEI